MYIQVRAAAFAAALIILSPLLGAAEVLSLVEARSLALDHSPLLQRARAQVDTARGDLQSAQTFPNNPSIEIEAANRSGADGDSTDEGIAVSQEFEIGGQRSIRTEVASAGVAAAEARYRGVEIELLVRVENAFAAVLAARERADLAESDLELTRRLLDFENRRLEAGAGTQLEVNVAKSAVGRAIRNREEALASVTAARAGLANALGMRVDELPPVGGSLTSRVVIPDLPSVMARSLDERPELAALTSEIDQRRHAEALARRMRVPNLELGVFKSSEEGDDIAGGALSIAVPLFNRNKGEIAVARGEIVVAETTLAQAELDVRQEVAAAHAHLAAAAASVRALDDLVVEPLDETLRLLERSFEAGKIDAMQVLLLRREVIDGRRDAIDAREELWNARADLALAAGTAAILLDGEAEPAIEGEN